MASHRPVIYPFQVTGHNVVCEIKKVAEGMLARVDMPGVYKDEVVVFVKEKTLYFEGEAFKEVKMEHNNNVESNPKVYLGSFNLCSDKNEIEEVKAEMKCGVLRMLVPTLVKGTDIYDQDVGAKLKLTDISSGFAP